MKLSKFAVWSAVFCLSTAMLQSQETTEAEKFSRQLKELQEQFERRQQQMEAKFERLAREQQAEIEGLKKRLAIAPTNTTANAAIAGPPGANQQPARPDSITAAAEIRAAPSNAVPETGLQSWTPSQPLTLARAGSAYMNISFDALMDLGWSSAHDVSKQLNLGDHDPVQRGFTLPNTEAVFEGAIDPYFKGVADIVFKLSKDNETQVELEEVYLTTTSLGGQLQLKAGQQFVNFGRQNPQHPHQWAFVDQPLILNRAFGPEGLRSLGATLSWLAPTPNYTELFLGVLNSHGESAFSFRNPGGVDEAGVARFHGRATMDRGLRGLGDLLYVPRIATSFDLTDAQTLLLGASAAFGPNETGEGTHTQVYGLDAYWKWKSPHAHAGFPFVSLQAEALFTRFEAGADPLAGLPAETLREWGGYSQVLWGFRPQWVAGLRGEYVTGNRGAFDDTDVFRGDRTRVSPNLTFYPSEYSKLRLQYNYDHGQHFGDEHAIWLQLEFLLGAHAAHKF